MSIHTIRSTSPILPDPDPESAISWQASLLVVMGAILGANLALWLMPQWIPALLNDVNLQQAPWHLARSAGVVAYGLLWLSTALGLSITGRLARLWPGGPTAFDLHQFSSLLALAAAFFHALILLGDEYIGYTPTQILIPFAARSYRPLSTAWGQLGLYVGVVIIFSFYIRNRIGRKAWRRLHYASFGMYILITIHSLLSGSDTSILWPLYFTGFMSILCLTLYRVFINIKSL